MRSRERLRLVTLAIGGSCALAAAMGIGRFIYTPILPFMEASLGWSKADGGLLASANYLGYLIGALAAAWVRLPGGTRRWFLAALMVSGVTTAAMAGLETMTPMLVVRFVSGVASAFVLVLASTLVLARITRAGRPGLFSLHFTGVGIGIAMSAVLVSQLATRGFGWTTFWIAGGCVAGAAWLAATLLVWVESEEATATTPADATPDGLNSSMWMLIVSYGLFGFGYVILGTFISAMVRDTPEIQFLESRIWLIVGLAAVPSVALWMWVARRWGYGFAYAAAAMTQAFGTLVCVMATAPTVILAAITLGGTIVSLTAIGLVHARNLTSRDPRFVLGLMTGAFGLGQIIGPLFAGYVSDATGSLMLALIGGSLALVGCALLTPQPWPHTQVA